MRTLTTSYTDIGGSQMRDFYDFRRMIAPDLIKSVYWLATLMSIGFGVFALSRASDSDFLRSIAPLNPNGLALLLLVVVPIALRIWAEFAVVVFEIHRTLEGVRRNTSRSNETRAGDEWAMPVIDGDLDPLSRLEAIDEAASDLWDEVAVDANDDVPGQIEEFERKPHDYLRATRMLRYQADLVAEEVEDRTVGRDRGVAQASHELSSALDVVASYIAALVVITDEQSAGDKIGEKLSLLERDFNVVYRTFADTMTGLDRTYSPAFEVE